jgi:hypothetical protein
MSQMDVHELARSHEDAERWLVALADLHKREVRRTPCAPGQLLHTLQAMQTLHWHSAKAGKGAKR